MPLIYIFLLVLLVYTAVTRNHSVVFRVLVAFVYVAVVFCAFCLKVVPLCSKFHILFAEVDLANDIMPRSHVVVSDFIHVDIVNGYAVTRLVALSMYWVVPLKHIIVSPF